MAALTAVAACATAARAEIAVIESVRDNTLYESDFGEISNGAGWHLFAGTTATGSRRRGVVAFNVADAIPAGSVVTSAQLQMYMSRTITAGEIVSLHRILADWGEGTSDAPGEEGAGDLATPGDATWVHTFFDTEMWASTGGDFEPVSSAEELVVGIAYYTWESTPALVANVQGWLDQPDRAFGWLVRGNEELFSTAKRFDTHEYPDVARRPKLIVEYVPVPEPSTAALLLVGGCAFIQRNRAGRLVRR